MLTPKSPRSDTNSSIVSRRAVLKVAAWSIPAIAVETATPALAASSAAADPGEDGGPGAVGPITSCVAPVLLAASWSSNNVQPSLERGATGWSPVALPAEQRNLVMTGAFAGDLGSSEGVSWASLHPYADKPGFMSVHNRYSLTTPTQIVVEQEYAVQENFKYFFEVQIAAQSAHLAVQLLDIDVVGNGFRSPPASGAGKASGERVVRVGVGNEIGNSWPDGLVPSEAWKSKYPDYRQLTPKTLTSLSFAFTPVRSDRVKVRYTFTLTADNSGGNQADLNADMWVSMAQPVCA